MRTSFVLATLLVAGLSPLAVAPLAAQEAPASIPATAAATTDRLLGAVLDEELRTLTSPRLAELLTVEERRVLGTQHIGFDVDRPAVISVLRPVAPAAATFWLADQGFVLTEMSAQVATLVFEV